MSFFVVDEYVWSENSNGNWVCQIAGEGEPVAVVFHKQAYDCWQIIINDKPFSKIVSGEYFADACEAQERAEGVLDGDDAVTMPLTGALSGRAEGVWRQQKKQMNGRPTYGRNYGHIKASVRCATSGQWYWMSYGRNGSSAPQGWFGSAEAAMQAADLSLEK